ncbi:ribosome maturation factor RimM [Roseomonas sp. CCTCC AB2023176]|uniref:ribosome maturation factor RimM n=1 Tax=Roseomonas sp. CCTCC AB2023176 TaxID=3342640 RepID=UPI0035DA6F34
MPPRRILVGEFGRPHGVKGLVHLRSFTADPAAIATYGPLSDESGARRFAITWLTEGLVRVEGVADRDAAARLTNTRLYVDRDAMPAPKEDEFYLSDLIGLAAIAADGAAIGTVASVDDYGAGAFLTIRDAAGKEILIPFTRACVPEVDVADGQVTVVPPEEITVPPSKEDAA